MDYLQNRGIPKVYLSWLLPRQDKKNQQITLTGLYLAGHLTHHIIGRVLATESNCLLIFDHDIVERNQLLQEYAEVLYQHGIYVLQLGWQWITTERVGRLILGKIFQAGRVEQSPLTQDMISLEYDIPTSLHSILQRFEQLLLLYRGEIMRETNQVLMITEFTPEIWSILRETKSRVVITTYLPKGYTQLLQGTGHHIIVVDTNILWNEVIRELYYVVKPRNLGTDYLLNDTNIKKNNGLDGI